MLVICAITITIGPLALIGLLRWTPPPISAFMLRDYLAPTPGVAIDYEWTDLEDIAPAAGVAVIASEDQRFLDHRGFDLDAIRSALSAANDGDRLRGASTISQQVAKNLFLWPSRSWVRKGLEGYLTVGLELLWSKRRILEVYVNVAEFGPGVYGVGAASRRFFGRAPHELDASEAALLAAVLPNPSTLRADRPSDRVRRRQAWIRTQMPHVAERLPVGFFSGSTTQSSSSSPR